ncbi:MAG: hypothetical protein B6D64_00815 [Bacteroidetes bacterium 4484_276]|nr:MAG: hypothetical protein B6D64_00815 [Bacteroidetes bacterium 4484_276]
METTFNEQDSIKVITEMIENSKSKIRDNGFFYLIWGWLVLVASVMNFVLLQIGFEQAWLPWPILMTGGGIASGIAGYRLGKKAKAKTMFDTAMIYLWYGFLVTLLIILFTTSSGKISWNVSNALIISLYGLGTFVSGGILKFKPLIIGGIISWALAIATLFVPEIYSLLMVAVSIIVSYLIPGYMLKSRNKNLGHV